MHNVSKLGKTLLQNLPSRGVRWGCCYGSRVMEPLISSGSQLDFLLAVDKLHLKEWHQTNLKLNPTHYSGTNRLFGISLVMKLQELPPGLFYHPFVKLSDAPLEFKYGVISTEDLCSDLNHWDHFYAAGRLQKPVKHIWPGPEDPEIKKALQTNLLAAVCCAAILINQKTISEPELYIAITGLSYLGDVRMGIGENPNKVKNIVLGQPNSLSEFRLLYEPALDSLSRRGFIRIQKTDESTMIDVCASPSELASLLPFQNLVTGTDFSALEAQLRLINKTSSKQQSMKGILTAGFSNSIVYSLHKLKKRFFSQQSF